MNTTETDSRVARHRPRATRLSTGRALAAGLFAGLVQPLASFVVALPPVALEIHHLEGPLLYGAVGVHLMYSALFGLGFAALAARSDRLGRRFPTTVAAGLGFGLVLWLVAVVVGWPLALRALGTPMAPPPLPYLHPHPMVGHVVYGVSLGVAVGAVIRDPDEPTASG